MWCEMRRRDAGRGREQLAETQRVSIACRAGQAALDSEVFEVRGDLFVARVAGGGHHGRQMNRSSDALTISPIRLR